MKRIFEFVRRNFVVVTVSVAIAAVLIFSIISVTVRNTYIATVTDKGIKRDENNTDKYLIYTDIGTFENTDEWLCGKFNSSDVYGRITVGETYEFTVVGFRVPLLSMYQNIIEVKSADKENNNG